MTEKEQSRYLANEMLNRDDADPDDYLAILSRQLLCADECIVELERQLAEARKALDEVWEVASGDCLLYTSDLSPPILSTTPP